SLPAAPRSEFAARAAGRAAPAARTRIPETTQAPIGPAGLSTSARSYKKEENVPLRASQVPPPLAFHAARACTRRTSAVQQKNPADRARRNCFLAPLFPSRC